jgi:hypothetical protein
MDAALALPAGEWQPDELAVGAWCVDDAVARGALDRGGRERVASVGDCPDAWRTRDVSRGGRPRPGRNGRVPPSWR